MDDLWLDYLLELHHQEERLSPQEEKESATMVAYGLKYGLLTRTA